jgi:hypothetical protein
VLIELTKAACAHHEVPFKSDPMSWGVTEATDERMTPFNFGDFKTEERKKTESDAIKYMSEPSVSREAGLSSFGVAFTIAAPGTGKTRLLDDLLRVTMPTTYYDHFLRLPITFNGAPIGHFSHPVAVRALLQFVCGTLIRGRVSATLSTLNQYLEQVCGPQDVDSFANAVLDAIETVYFQFRGGVLGRSVLLIDEIKLASYNPPRVSSELNVYQCITLWIDDGSTSAADGRQTPSRRGVVFTGVSVLSPFALESSTGRPIVPLPLGIFDVYDDGVRGAIALQAGCEIHPAGWALLAASGGRPRDILDILAKMEAAGGAGLSDRDRLLSILCDVARADNRFSEYLLPSLMCVRFEPFVEKGIATQFGLDVASLSLLNSDSASNMSPVVPAVSLRYVNTLDKNELHSIVRCLVSTMVFDVLDGSGKDFERAWALLTICVLQLQFLVRSGAGRGIYWPIPADGVQLGGPHCPTAREINVFASADRSEALFMFLRSKHAFEVSHSTIHRMIQLSKSPTLAVWHDPWARTVRNRQNGPIPSNVMSCGGRRQSCISK